MEHLKNERTTQSVVKKSRTVRKLKIKKSHEIGDCKDCKNKKRKLKSYEILTLLKKESSMRNIEICSFDITHFHESP